MLCLCSNFSRETRERERERVIRASIFFAVVFIFGFLLLPGKSLAATYYVSNLLGDDTRTSVQAQNSSTPWQNHPDSSLATSNSAAMRLNLVAGDKIIMYKGDIWYNTSLSSAKAGTGSADNQLIITTIEDGFGTGANPIIAGAILENGAWTATGVNGEYKISLTTQPSVVFNGDAKLTSGTIGSLPNNGFGWSSNFLYVKIGSDPTGGNIQASQRTALVINNNYRAYKNLDLRYTNGTTQGVVYSISAIGMVLDQDSISRGNTYAIRCFGCISPIISNSTSSQADYLIAMKNGGSGGQIYNNTLIGSGKVSGGTIGVLIASGSGNSMSVYSNNISSSAKGIEDDGSNTSSIYSNAIGSSLTGIEINGNSSSSVYSNTLTNNNVGMYVAGNNSSIYLNAVNSSTTNSNTPQGIEIAGNNNYVHNNSLSNWNGVEYPSGGFGYDMTVTGSNNAISKNYFHDGYENLILEETSGNGNNTITSNIFNSPHINSINLGTGGTTINPDLVVNNIIIHSPTGGNPAGSVGHGMYLSATGVHGLECTHANVKNNLFVGKTSGAEMFSIDTGLLLNTNHQMNQISMDYNYYWQKNSGSAWRMFDNSGSDATNFLTWQSSVATSGVTGAEAHSVYTSSIGSSPFINIDSNNLLPVYSATSIDTGTTTSNMTATTTDYAGNNIYGVPDIGAYEYQPPYTFALNHLPTTGSARLYSDGKYRMTTASTTSALANFSISPIGGYLATTTQYLDITLNSWSTTGDRNKEWTASSTDGAFNTHATSTVYTIGDLLPSTYYQFKLDGLASTTAISNNSQCTNGLCLSDLSGMITFTYTAGYSNHVFDLIKLTTAPTSPTAPTFGTISTSSIQIIEPTASATTGLTLATWQVRRNSTIELGFIATTTTSTADSNLTENTQYTYDVQFKDNNQNLGNYGSSSSKYTLADAPTNLITTNVTVNSINLSVDSFPNDHSGLSGYFFTNTTNGANSNWLNTNTWSDTSNLSCNHPYTYQVKYRNGDGVETDLATQAITTSACTDGSVIIFPVSQTTPATDNANANTDTLGNSNISASMTVSNTQGEIIKINSKDRPAVYYVVRGQKYLFANRSTYTSWSKDAGDITNKFTTLKLISQTDFDAIPSAGNLVAKPGSLIKFDNSPAVYAVATGGKLYLLSNSAALKALYGSAKPIIIQAGFRDNYYDHGNSVGTLTAGSAKP